MKSNSVRATAYLGRALMAAFAAIVMIALMMPSANAFAVENGTQAAAESAVAVQASSETSADATQSVSADASAEQPAKTTISLSSTLISWGVALACVAAEAAFFVLTGRKQE